MLPVPSPGDLPVPGIQPKSPALAGGFFTTSATWETLDSVVKNLPAEQETWVQSLGWEDPLEEEMATHSSIPAWEIPWTEDPGWLQSMGSKKN